jgi:hypothetical protein
MILEISSGSVTIKMDSNFPEKDTLAIKIGLESLASHLDAINRMGKIEFITPLMEGLGKANNVFLKAIDQAGKK